MVNFGSDPAGGFKALRDILPNRAADVRGVLSGLVRHAGARHITQARRRVTSLISNTC